MKKAIVKKARSQDMKAFLKALEELTKHAKRFADGGDIEMENHAEGKASDNPDFEDDSNDAPEGPDPNNTPFTGGTADIGDAISASAKTKLSPGTAQVAAGPNGALDANSPAGLSDSGQGEGSAPNGNDSSAAGPNGQGDYTSQYGSGDGLSGDQGIGSGAEDAQLGDATDKGSPPGADDFVGPSKDDMMPPPEETASATGSEVTPTNMQSGAPHLQSNVPTPAPTPQQLNAEDAAWAQDLQNGHITPETYQSLFNNKSTLGKIGTMFGLIVGGAGAGLTHQPNAVMQQMQQELDRDLQAQEHSKQNVLNYASASLHHAQTVQGYENANLTASDSAMNRMKLAAVYGELGNSVKNLPPGPYSQAAQQALGGLQNQVTQDVQSTNQKVSDQLTAAAPPVDNGTGVDGNKLSAAIRLGQIVPFAKGAIPPGMAGTAMTEAAKVTENRSMAAMYDKSFKALSQFKGAGANAVTGAGASLAKLAGPIPLIGGPISKAGHEAESFNQWRIAQIATLAPMISRATAGRYNQSEAEAQADGLFPTWKDLGDSKTREAKYNNSMAWFKAQEATPALDFAGAKTPFPNYSYKAEDWNKQIPNSQKAADNIIAPESQGSKEVGPSRSNRRIPDSEFKNWNTK